MTINYALEKTEFSRTRFLNVNGIELEDRNKRPF